MFKRPILLFLCFFFVFSFASAEELTITTYYPSPYGSYNELRTSGNTYLAIDSGNVGIGTLAPAEKLQVSGNVMVDGTLIANRIDAPGIFRQILSVSPTANVSTTSASYVNMPGMNLTIDTGESFLLIFWNAGLNDEDMAGNGSMVHARVLVDGGQVGTYTGGAFSWKDADNDGDGDIRQITVDSMSGTTFVPVSAGSHTVLVQWKVTRSGTAHSYPAHADGYTRTLTVMEISR